MHSTGIVPASHTVSFFLWDFTSFGNLRLRFFFFYFVYIEAAMASGKWVRLRSSLLRGSVGMEIDEQGWPPSLFPEGKRVLPGLFWKESCLYSPSPGSGVNRAPTFYQWLRKLWLLIYIKKERKKNRNKTETKQKQPSIGQFRVLLDPLRFPFLCLLKQFSHTVTTHWLYWSLLSNQAQRVQLGNTFTLNYIFQRKRLVLASPRVFHFDKDRRIKRKQIISYWGFQPLIQGRHKKGCDIRSSLCLWNMLQGWPEKRQLRPWPINHNFLSVVMFLACGHLSPLLF